MVNIRKGIFETNSSSTHAICISKNNATNFPESLHFGFGEFGWTWEKLNTVQDRANYLYTAVVDSHGSDRDFVEKFKNYIYDVLGIYNCEATFEPYTINKDYGWVDIDGYVDHAGCTIEFIDAIMSSEKRLLRYLFSENSFIQLGNDNNPCYEDWFEMFDFSNYELFEKTN